MAYEFFGTFMSYPVRKEPELVKEAERYSLDIGGLTSTRSLGSGTRPLFMSERQREGVALLITTRLSAGVLNLLW